MYEEYFKFNGRPFLPAPQVSRYFPAAIIENARQTLSRTIERGEGAGLVVGPAGTGKTLLCQVLAQQFAEIFAVAHLTSGRLATRAALLQAILYELGLPYRGMDEGELRLSLLDFVEPSPDSKRGLLLLVDEAHTLPLRLLEEIRMITNLVRDGQPRVRVVLAGNPLLEERFASPKLSSFAQRIAARTYLEPLDAAQTAAYVRSQIKAVGGDAAALVDDEALRSIYRATDGIPRLINQVCDHALILASLGGETRLSVEAVEEAWADLQQLPTPSGGAFDESSESNVIEFGALSDSHDDRPEAIPFHAPAATFDIAHSEDEAEDAPEATGACFVVPHDLTDEETRTLVGYSGTEVELDFPEIEGAFGEGFEEEEVVLDRYASDIEIFADVPRVSSWEGGQLGPILDRPTPTTHPESAKRPEPATIRFAATPERDEPMLPVGGPISSFTGSNFAIVSTPGATSGGRAFEPVSAGPPDAGAFWAGGTPSPLESDLLVIEDEISPAAMHPPKKREFRQLFARLRRG